MNNFEQFPIEDEQLDVRELFMYMMNEDNDDIINEEEEEEEEDDDDDDDKEDGEERDEKETIFPSGSTRISWMLFW